MIFFLYEPTDLLCDVFQVAQQDAQRSVYFVDRAIQEKQQKIVQAEGEAKAAELISFICLSVASQLSFSGEWLYF